MCADLSTEGGDQAAELVAAVLEVPELVVARARGREQYDVARLRLPRRRRDRLREVADAHRSGNRGRELAGGLAEHVGAANVGAESGRERREVLALPRPAQDQQKR